MKENTPTPETVKTPPPLTPKDSLSVELEEIAKRLNKELVGRTLHDTIVVDLARLLSIVEELKAGKSINFMAAEGWKEMLEAAQAQLRRKDEALREAKFLAAHAVGMVGGSGAGKENEERNLAEVKRINALIDAALNAKEDK